MTTTADKRRWLAANGHPQLANGRGRLAATLLAEYDAAHPAPPADDYPAGVGPEDFVTADDPPADPAPGAAVAGEEEPSAPAGTVAGVAEERPQRPRAGRRSGRGWFTRAAAPAAGRKKPRKKFPRVSVAPLIEDTYADLAWAAAAIPPLQRCLYAQAPIAGVILDPAVKDTFIDRAVLQLAARNYDRARIVLALAGVPASLMAVLGTAPQPVMEGGQIAWQQATDDEGRPLANEDGTPVLVPRMHPATLQHQTALLTFRYCVRAMADLSGDALERVQQRAEDNEQRDGMVDAFMAYLLGAAPPADERESKRREGARAGLNLAGSPS